MKNSFSNFLPFLYAFISIAFFSTIHAQTIIAPTSCEYTYPIGTVPAQHTSAIAMNNYEISAWDGPGGGIVSVRQNNSNPLCPTPICSTQITYGPIFRDLEVAMIEESPGNDRLIVAYHTSGSLQHAYDVYSVNGCNVVLLGTTFLSLPGTSYSRISIDQHNHTDVVISWSESDIKTVVLQGGAGIQSSGIITFNGTAGYYGVDVGFNHFTGDPKDHGGVTPSALVEIHYVYQQMLAMHNTQVLVSRVNFDTLLSKISNDTLTPLPEDTNPIITPIAWFDPVINLDAPDHSHNAFWSYAFDQYGDIVTRTGSYTNAFINSATVNQLPLNTPLIGTSAATPTMPTDNVKPFPVFIPSSGAVAPGIPDGIIVGWHTNFYNTLTSLNESYVTVTMNEMGNTLINTPNYYAIPNITNLSPADPTLAFSKADIAPYLYAVYPQDNSGIQMQHKFHQWSNTASFREGREEDASNAIFVNQPSANLYPNPSNGVFTIEWNGTSQVTDILVYNSMGQLIQSNTVINQALVQLELDIPEGIYNVVLRSANAIQHLPVLIE